MSRTIALDPESGDLVVEFRFDRALKDRVKAMRGSRFHWATKTWRFPPERAGEVVAELGQLGFAVVDPDLAAALGGGAVALEAAASAPRETGNGAPRIGEGPTDDTFTVSNLLAVVGAAVAARVPSAVWVSGTLAEYERGAHRAHAWCRLVEEDPDGRPVAVFPAVMFAQARERIARRLAGAGLELADGLAVRVLARVELYVPKGALQLVIEDIDPGWSAGELALRREEILRQLREERLDTLQLDLPMPRLPRRIALVTSANSDAYHDVLSSLRNGGFGLDVVPYDVRVQGPELASTVCAALEAIESAGTYDLVVITRGGGSRVELAAWDDLRVARAVARSSTKVLVAIGHHQDRSVLDDIATSAKTPTEAGEWIVGLWLAAEDELRSHATALERRVQRRLALERRRIEASARGIEVAVRQRMGRHRDAIGRMRPRLETAVRARLRLVRLRAARLEPRLSGAAVRRSIDRRADGLDALARRLVRAAPTASRRAGAALDDLEVRLRLVHPDNVVRRGFAIVRDASGVPIPSAGALLEGQHVHVEMRDGRVSATVDAVEPATPREHD